MRWLAPWALVGLSAIALPILIHLLGRGQAKTQLFPTLRFIERTRLLPTRRTRLHDLLLLLVRVAIIASAALALAQPYWPTATRRAAFEQTLARAIVLDTSASVRRVQAADSSRALAARLASDANVSVMLFSNDVSNAIPGALAWLSQKSERRELLVVSDFQAGVIDAGIIARIPSDVGVSLLRIGSEVSTSQRASPSQRETVSQLGANTVTAHTSIRADSSNGSPSRMAVARDVEWVVTTRDSRAESPVGGSDASRSVRLLAGTQELPRANAALAAANSVTEALPAADSSHAIVIVTAGAEQRPALLATARAPSKAWMYSAISRLNGDDALQDAAAGERQGTAADSSNGVVVARTTDGRTVVSAAEAIIDGKPALALFDNADAGSLTTATLIIAARNATRPAVTEQDPTQIPDSVLRAWQRTPSAELRSTVAASDDNASTSRSDGRLLWVLALVLLLVETILRRASRSPNADVGADVSAS